MVLSGKGSMAFLTQEFEEDRQRALEDRTRFTDAELDTLGITATQGGGETDEDSFEIKTFPYPLDKAREKIDIREVDPRIGD